MISISIYPLLQLYQQKIPFFAATKLNFLVTFVLSFSFKTVLIDFLTIMKYRKKDISKILNCWLLLFNSERYPSNCWVSFCRYAISFPLSLQVFYNWDMIIYASMKFDYWYPPIHVLTLAFYCQWLPVVFQLCILAPSGSLILYAPILAMLTNHCILSYLVGCYSFHPW